MGTFIVSPSADSVEWSIGVDEFVRFVRGLWPDARFTHQHTPGHTYPTHAYAEGEQPLIILGLDAAGSTLSVDGELPRVVRTALRWRELVPDDVELLFFDQEFTAEVALAGDATPEALAAPFPS